MLDYNLLINPINEEKACGVDIRIDQEAFKIYSELKDLRTSLRREERQTIEVDQNAVIDKEGWEKVITSANTILCNYSKDTEVAAWLLESLTRVQEFVGLELGLTVLVELLKKYGLDLYPEEEEGDVEYKLLPIATLGGKYEAGTLIAPIYFSNIARTRSGTSYTVWQLKEELDGGKSSNHNQVTQEKILECEALKLIVNEIDKEYLLKLKDSLVVCIAKFKELNSLLSSLFSSNAPNMVNLSNVLDYSFSLVNNFDKIIQSRQGEETSVNTGGSEQINGGANNLSISIDNLEQMKLDRIMAVRLLKMLMKYFKETEPHSPISYTLDRVIFWSDLSLPELLCDLVPDNIRQEYCRYTGIPFLEDHNQGDTEN